ncbi:class I SAM-dependent methyltransferase [Nocardia sp. NPDC004722]
MADIGFGGGVGLSLLLDRVGAGGTVHGVDISPDMVARLTSRYGRELGNGRLRLQTGSITELPFAAASLDALITVNTLYFVDDLDRACTELRRVLRPGGTAVVGVGEPEDMARVPFSVHVRVRPVAEVTAAMRRAGLTVTQSTVERWPIDGHCLVGRAES